MKKPTTVVASAIVFAILALCNTPHAEAALISQSRLDAQREVIQDAHETLLEERLKLVQMRLINALELRVLQLKEQVENQK